MLKTFTTIFFLLLLNGCIQNTAFLGPVITGASTGSIHQAALSYGSNKAIKKITGKTPAENLKQVLMINNKIDIENANNFFNTIKKMNENSSIKNLANQ
tara:strand:- start:20 stop:316 length:297 start_codon:yes stop_codon:yes gene_type:complete